VTAHALSFGADLVAIATAHCREAEAHQSACYASCMVHGYSSVEAASYARAAHRDLEQAHALDVPAIRAGAEAAAVTAGLAAVAVIA
jgi:hypothetical protein